MTIEDEAPTIHAKAVKCVSLWEAIEECEPDQIRDYLAALSDRDSVEYAALDRWKNALSALSDQINSYTIGDKAKERFTAAIERDRADKKLTNAEFHISLSRRPDFDLKNGKDWFSRRVFNEGGILDVKIYYDVCHVALLEEANLRWRDDARFRTLQDKGNAEQSYYERSRKTLERYGFMDDLSLWSWVAEAIEVAETALARIGIAYGLSDLVEWTCSHSPGNMTIFSEFSEPVFIEKAPFGARYLSEESLQRLSDANVIWKTECGSFISPLWEYLAWRSDDLGEHSEYARRLGEIGEGLDSAALVPFPDFDPKDRRQGRLAPADIFRAGKAVTHLRIKLELEEIVTAGRIDIQTRAKRAKLGGKASANKRACRMEDLMAAIERLIDENPIAIELDQDRIATLAAKRCAEANPSLWSQGLGQATEYLGEIRRGEAGPELSKRYRQRFTDL